VFGTPEFMAPEQAEGRQDAIDHRSDQWSLACLAWFSATACLPFTGPDVNAILNQVISAVPTPPGPGAPRLPEEVDKVLRRALSRHRSDRFPTIRAFARTFEAAASPERDQVARMRGTPTPPRALAAQAPGRPAHDAAAAILDKPRRRSGGRTWLVLIAVLAMLSGAGWLFRGEPPISSWLESARGLLQRR